MDSSMPGKPMKDARRSERGCTLHELLFLILLIGCISAGIGFGYEIGSPYGIAWSVLGIVVGLVLGIAVPILLLLGISAISEPIRKRWREKHPWNPSCENGVCGDRNFKYEKTPEDLYNNVRGLSPVCERCNCGDIYVSLNTGIGTWHRMRILPDGSLKPYMMQPMIGAWRPDEGTWLEDWLKKSKEPEVSKEFSVPDWMGPWIVAIICTGTISLAALSQGSITDQFTIGIILFTVILSLVVGYGMNIYKKAQERQKCWAEAHPEEEVIREKRKEKRQKIYDFFIFKFWSVLPAILFGANIHSPNPDRGSYYLALFFFGSWFIAFFFTCGLSFREYRDGIKDGLNKYCYIISGMGYAVWLLQILAGSGIMLARMLLYGKMNL